jgi:hypothetical protein
VTLYTAASFGVAGLVAGAATGAPPAAAALLGGGSCAVASCFVPLSVRGRIDHAAWVWRLTRRWLLASSWASASLALVLAALVPVHVLVLARDVAAGPALAQVLVFAVLAWASALAAGSVAPRRPGGAGDDALSFGAFVATGITIGAAVAAVGARLQAAGVPGAVAVVLVAGLAAAGAVSCLALLLERG